MPGSSVPPAAEVVPRLQVRDPDAWLRAACFAVVGLAALQILVFSFGRDQGIYAVVGEGILHGKVPYKDLWDFKPPGIFFVYALAQGLFGKSMLAPRLVEVLGLVLLVACSGRLARTFFGTTTVGYVGGALAALIHAELDFWHTGQPETFGGVLTFVGLVLTTSEGKRTLRYWRWLGLGAVFGCAALLKPPLGGGALVCAAYLFKREQLQHNVRGAVLSVTAVAAGVCVPFALTLGWFALRGGLGALYWTMHDFTPGYTALGWEGRRAPEMFYYALQEAFFKFSAVNTAGVVAAVAITPMHLREREGIFIVLGVIAMHVTGIAMQGKFFPYHYAATLPLIAFLAGLGLYKLFRRCLAGGPGGVLAFVAFVGACVAMRQAVGDLPQDFWERSAIRMKYLLRIAPYDRRETLDAELATVADVSLIADRAVALELRSRTGGSAPVFVWGFEPVIYWLAGREPASRFIYDVPQRTPWQRQRARHDMMQDLALHPPAAIVVQRNDVFPMVTGDTLDSRRALATFPEFERLLDTRYELATTIEDFDVFVPAHRSD
ncbi:MAG TPA: glycosyltransferase family 39 protein [Polyangiaceae bacterium]|nr:glycosyltransferase family 39 protein [Polyangiaceae bacterium]